ncbi:MAG: transcription antitermination factor NusB [Phycisphaerales bacterium]
MATRRDIRRSALQWLYQLDAGATIVPPEEPGDPTVGDEAGAPQREHRAMRGVHEVASDPDEAFPDAVAARRGYDLATLAWEFHGDADARVAPLTPEWPLHRQPMIDRNVLRLAWYEVVHQGVPARVAINEAIELAREFGGERSPAFVNGVLDRVFRANLESEVAGGQRPASSE